MLIINCYELLEEVYFSDNLEVLIEIKEVDDTFENSRNISPGRDVDL